MDFFDTALDKAKETWEIVSKKTEEVVDVQKKKFNIASLENQCAKAYKSIGEIVYNKYRDNFSDDNELNALFEQISKNQVIIAETKAELNSK